MLGSTALRIGCRSYSGGAVGVIDDPDGTATEASQEGGASRKLVSASLQSGCSSYSCGAVGEGGHAGGAVGTGGHMGGAANDI